MLEHAKIYADRLAAIGKVEPLEEYRGTHTKILHRCLVHGETQLAVPLSMLKGKGLKCCLVSSNQATADRTKAECAAAYDAKLNAIGKLECIGEYIDSKTRILHKCLEHGTVELTTPNEALGGHGLWCCKLSSAKSEGKKRKAAAGIRYVERLKKHTYIELLGDYIDHKTPILHKCHRHGETHLAPPAQIMRGSGLNCCGARGVDSMGRFIEDKFLAEAPCHVYIARVNGSFLKPGISKNPEHRMSISEDNYSSYAFISPALTRAEAWAIEQRLLRESMDAKPETLPEIYAEWTGRTELRLKDTLPESWYISRYWELMEELDEEGWEAVASA